MVKEARGWSNPGEDEQVWGDGLGRWPFCVPPIAMLTWFAMDGTVSDIWPMVVPALILTVIILRRLVRITPDELVIRHPLWTRRVPRSDVESARFTYFGLRIHLRDGRTCFATLSPG